MLYRFLHAEQRSRFGVSLQPACDLRCRLPLRTNALCVLVRLASGYGGIETSDTPRRFSGCALRSRTGTLSNLYFDARLRCVPSRLDERTCEGRNSATPQA